MPSPFDFRAFNQMAPNQFGTGFNYAPYKYFNPNNPYDIGYNPNFLGDAQKQSFDYWNGITNPPALNSWAPTSQLNGNWFKPMAPTLSNPTTTRVIGSFTGNGSALDDFDLTSPANNFTNNLPVNQNTDFWENLWGGVKDFGSGIGNFLANENLMKGIGTVGNLGLNGFAIFNALRGSSDARDAAKFNRRVIENNITNNLISYNTQLKDRMAARAMAQTGNPDAYNDRVKSMALRDLNGTTPGVIA